MINTVFQIAVSRGLKQCFAVADQFECDFGMSDGKALHQIADIAGFRRCCFQEFSPRRSIVEQTAHQKGSPLRSADFRQFFFLAAVDYISASGKFSPRFCHELYHGDGSDA